MQIPSKKFFFSAAAILLLAEAGIQGWNSWAIPVAEVSHILRYTFPEQSEPGFHPLDINGLEGSELLAYDHGEVGRFIETPGKVMDVIYLEHDAGNERYLADTLGHQPEVCMTNSGAKLLHDNGTRRFPLDDQMLRIRCLIFSEAGSEVPVYVYKLVWVPPAFETKGDPTWSAQKEIWIRRALTRLPWPPSRLILAGIRGGTEEEAWRLFESTILEKLTLEPVEVPSP